jgi:hypothetical protein
MYTDLRKVGSAEEERVAFDWAHVLDYADNDSVIRSKRDAPSGGIAPAIMTMTWYWPVSVAVVERTLVLLRNAASERSWRRIGVDKNLS